MSKKKIKEIEENELVVWMEKKLGHLKPYAWNIALVICVAILCVIGVAYYIQYRMDLYSNQWRDLNLSVSQARLDGNPARLMYVAEQYPNQKAGLWALQLAGDLEMRGGISMLPNDRVGGLDRIRKAKEYYQSVVDSSADKSTMLQRRSLFGLAYANESLGEFQQANSLYKRLAEEAADSAFAGPARRGVMRTADDNYVALYHSFKSWEDSGTAPGPGALPRRPNIDFPEIDLSAVENPNGGTDVASAHTNSTLTSSQPPEDGNEPPEVRVAETADIQSPAEDDPDQIELEGDDDNSDDDRGDDDQPTEEDK